MREPEPSAVGFMWVWLVVTCELMLVNGPSTISGSVASIHQASTPIANSAVFICDQYMDRAPELKAS